MSELDEKLEKFILVATEHGLDLLINKGRFMLVEPEHGLS